MPTRTDTPSRLRLSQSLTAPSLLYAIALILSAPLAAADTMYKHLPIQYEHPDVLIYGALSQGGMLIGRTKPEAKVYLDGQELAVSEEGVFVMGFGRNAFEQADLLIKHGAKESAHKLAIKQRQYETQRIDRLDKDKVTPPPGTYDRIAEDIKEAKQARSQHTEMLHFASDFIWPAHGIITGVYGVGRILNGQPRSPHYGVDIAAPEGTPVVMPATGTIVLVRDMYFSGITVVIDHGYGVFSTMLHLSKVHAKEGAELKQGEVFAEVGSTGRSTGPHLDWRLNWYGRRLDPQLVVGTMPKP